MAENTFVNNHHTDVEPVVNRWLCEYFAWQAVTCFRENKYEEFDAIRTQLEYVLTRPLEHTGITASKVKVVHFLSRINEGENLDMDFESADITPLESALTVLEDISHDFKIPSKDLTIVSTSIKEMIVKTLIKNEVFDKASEMLNKHFPATVGKKSVFMGLIKQKSKAHKIIEQLNFQRFREEMVDFCQKFISFSIPFLYKAAKQLIEDRCEPITDQATECCDQEVQRLSCIHVSTHQVVNREFSVIQRARLELAYKTLAAGSENAPTFAQLEEGDPEEQEREDPHSQHSPEPESQFSVYSELECQLRKDSSSPIEASPADQPRQMDAISETQASSLAKTPPVLRSRRPYTVARLVVEPDSQPSSQCTITSQTGEDLLGSQVSSEEQPQLEDVSNKTPLEGPEIEKEVPRHKMPRSKKTSIARASSSGNVLSLPSDEHSPDPMTNEEPCNQSTNSMTRNSWSTETSVNVEEAPLAIAAPCQTPEQPNNFQNQTSSTTDEIHTADSSLDSSSNQDPPSAPQQSSTPHKGTLTTKWRKLFSDAKESKERWSDDSFSPAKKSKSSNTGQKRRRWTDCESDMLEEGVKKFGEGNWSKIKSYYSFNNRTNVNLKDRWRTLQKLKNL